MSEGKGNGKGAGAGAGTSAARARLLATATRIFYAEGIHAVGVDRIVSEAEVTRATLYRHFAGKEELVLACLAQVDQGMRAGVEAAVREAGPSAADAVRAVAGFITGGIRSEGFRGCAFLNAAVEYPDPDHPVHQAVLTHRGSRSCWRGSPGSRPRRPGTTSSCCGTGRWPPGASRTRSWSRRPSCAGWTGSCGPWRADPGPDGRREGQRGTRMTPSWITVTASLPSRV
jgi:AcrR family transcriptional regulator